MAFRKKAPHFCEALHYCLLVFVPMYWYNNVCGENLPAKEVAPMTRIVVEALVRFLVELAVYVIQKFLDT